MYHNEGEIRQFLRVSLGVLCLTAVMLGVYAIIGRFTLRVLIGAAFGAFMSCANFLALTITVSRASDRAQGGDPAKAKMAVQGSSVLRLLVLAAVYIVVLKAKFCDPIAAILPLVFVQISISVTEFFRKDGDK